MSLPKISKTQRQIINALQKNQNIYICGSPGCGKTSTILQMALNLPEKNFLQLTYNSDLKTEVRQKVQKYEIENLEIHSYHSLAVKYYDNTSYTDDIMIQLVDNDVEPLIDIPDVDIIVIDESQDMNALFYSLLVKFIKDMNNEDFIFVILGDVNQSINKFRSADHRYLTLCSEIWNRKFVNINLDISYRLTNTMSSFINNVMLGETVINTVRDGDPVTYINCNPYEYAKILAQWILCCIDDGIYKPDDFFILGYSLKKRNPLKLVENFLSKKGTPCFYSTAEEKQVDSDIIKGKVVFSTFHGSKGRQRKVCVVFGFDNTYFKYFDRSSPPTECPNTVYVAVSRAEERLILIKDSKSQQFPFLKMSETEIAQLDYVDYINNMGRGYYMNDDKEVPENDKVLSVTSLVSFIKNKYLSKLTYIRKKLFEKEDTEAHEVCISSKIDCKYTMEDVSEINGIVIPAYFEYRSTGNCSIANTIKVEYEKLKSEKKFIDPLLSESYEKIDKIDGINDIINLTKCYLSLSDQTFNRLKLITRDDWIEDEEIQHSYEILSEHLDFLNTTYEDNVNGQYDSENYGTVKINGRLDCISNATVFELKCVRSLTLEHFIQLIVYAFLIKQTEPALYQRYNFKLLNVLTNDVYVLKDKNSKYIDEVMKMLIENKYKTTVELTDNEFLDMCKKLKKGFT